MGIREYYKTIDGRIGHLLNQVPPHRPLPAEALECIDRMSIAERERLSFSAYALIDNLNAQVRELQMIKARADAAPTLRSVK